MKRKLIEKYPPLEPFEQTGKEIRAQAVNEILILDIWETGLSEEEGKQVVINKLLARHLVNVETGEHETYDGAWHATNIYSAIGYPEYRYYYNNYYEEDMYISAADERLIREYFYNNQYISGDVLYRICYKEHSYDENKRFKAEQRREQKINDIMDTVPAVPEINDWIFKTAGWEYYAMKDKKKNVYCTACAEQITIPKGTKDRSLIICPSCGKEVRYLARKRTVQEKARFVKIDKIESGCVARYFKTETVDVAGMEKGIENIEEARLIIPKNGLNPRSEGILYKSNLYYEQYLYPKPVTEGEKNKGWWDNKHNRSNKHLTNCYLMESGIEYLEGTGRNSWIRLLKEFSGKGYKLNYINILQASDKRYVSLIEMLYRNRFYKLMKSEIESFDVYYMGYYGKLDITGRTIEEIFGINDRQRINRIRNLDGGRNMLSWMKKSERLNLKIKDDTLKWLEENDLNYYYLESMLEFMTIEQIRNYITRQQSECYKGKTAREVINQYYDYINMLRIIGKDTSDEMIYRPRELKRRHDEAVLERERMQAKADADEYSKRYSEAENHLREVTNKLTYEDDDYFIKVPERIIDIVTEGRYLHHCVGSTDRYFDRMKHKETYICFLRKKESPEEPFYTIEVEPGGTVRQHRGMYDEEPEFDKVEPFIKKWQQTIKKRMTEYDKCLARISEKARNDNMDELIKANNTRVIKGLLEDLMEVS